MLTRRHFVTTTTTLFSGAIAMPALAQDAVGIGIDEAIDQPVPAGANPWGLHERFMPTRVQANSGLNADAIAKYGSFETKLPYLRMAKLPG